MYCFLFFIIVCFFVFLFLLSKNFAKTNQSETQQDYPYIKKRFFFSKAESNFYKVLLLALKDTDYTIFAKVRLIDIISVSKTDSRQKYLNKIISKHVDFLICNKDYYNPLLVIELNDSSHNRPDRVERDNFLEKALLSAKLPFVTFPVKQSYDINVIKDSIFSKIEKINLD